MCRIKDRRIGSDDIGMKDFAAVKVLEIVFEILQDKRVVTQESPQKPEAGRCSLRIAHPNINLTNRSGHDKLLPVIPAKSGFNGEGMRPNGGGLEFTTRAALGNTAGTRGEKKVKRQKVKVKGIC